MNDSAVDFVITWVNGSDPAWQADRAKYARLPEDMAPVRFRDWGLLRYWFRGVEQFAPWVRKIHFVTWGHIPEWLDTSNPKLQIVCHKDFIPLEYLPTFNSRTIEFFMHRIPDLAEQFVYFNDDMFLTRPVTPERFFRKGLPRDSFGLDSIYFCRDSIAWSIGSNIAIINECFPLRQVLRAHGKKVFSPRNGIAQIVRNVLFGALHPYFPGFRNEHSACSYLKDSFQIVWEKQGAALENAVSSRFRPRNSVNHFLIRYWQLVSGRFDPIRSKRNLCIHLSDSSVKKAASIVLSQRFDSVCLNDTIQVANVDIAAATLRDAFDTILDKPSQFEKKDGIRE